MKKISAWIGVSMLGLVLLGAGCQRHTDPSPSPTNTQPSSSASSSATILVSTEETNKYCNGADMDSEGYRKTITGLRTTEIPPYQHTTEYAKSILLAATSGMCRQVIENSSLTLRNGELHIPPIDGWAGVSITMCSCKPQIEVNALRIPGITQVVWDER